MIVSYRTAVAGSAYVTLFDESAGGAMLSEFKPSFRPLNQATALYGSNAEFRESLGNIVCSLPLPFNVEYKGATARQAALASVRTFAALVGTKVHLQVVQDNEIQFYPNALVESYAATLWGASVDHVFQFLTDALTLAAP